MPTIININKIIIIITTILIAFLTTEALGSVPPSLGHCNACIITVILGLTLFRLPSFHYHLSFQRHAWASFASCSCTCVNLWLLWEDLEICGQPWHSEYGHIFLQASVCVRAALHYIHWAVSDSPTSAWACLGLVSPHRPLPALWLRACSLWGVCAQTSYPSMSSVYIHLPQPCSLCANTDSPQANLFQLMDTS